MSELTDAIQRAIDTNFAAYSTCSLNNDELKKEEARHEAFLALREILLKKDTGALLYVDHSTNKPYSIRRKSQAIYGIEICALTDITPDGDAGTSKAAREVLLRDLPDGAVFTCPVGLKWVKRCPCPIIEDYFKVVLLPPHVDSLTYQWDTIPGHTLVAPEEEE